MVFDGSGEFRPGIEESCNSGVVFYEDMDDFWQTEDIWGELITESFNVRGTGINGDDKLFLFYLLYLLLNHRLSRVVFCEELYDWWQTEDSWGGLMNELFNGGGTCINGGDNLLIF